MKTLRRSTLIRIAVYGGLVFLAATIWAWALGFAAWHGAVAGAVLGLPFGVLVGRFMEAFGGAADHASLIRFAHGSWIILLLLALSIVGAIVGIAIRLVS